MIEQSADVVVIGSGITSAATAHALARDGTTALREREPALAPTVLAASLCPTDGSADSVASVQAFARAAERLGARPLLGERVTGLEVTGGRLEAVRTDRQRIAMNRAALACGALGNELLAPLGLAAPLRQPMVTVLQTEPMPPLLGSVLGVANADMAGRQERSGRLRVTSGAGDWHGQLTTELEPRVSPPTGGVARVIEKLSHVLPAIRTCAIHSLWAGLLDLTPSGLPVVDHVPKIDGLTTAMGFSGHGFAIGPITGEIIAALVQGRPMGFDLAPFRFDRFNDTAVPAAGLTLHG